MRRRNDKGNEKSVRLNFKITTKRLQLVKPVNHHWLERQTYRQTDRQIDRQTDRWGRKRRGGHACVNR